MILVNSRSGEAPDKAQAIAQANLAGGGEAQAGRATSPLPPSALTELGDANEETRKQIEQLQETQQQMLTQARVSRPPAADRSAARPGTPEGASRAAAPADPAAGRDREAHQRGKRPAEEALHQPATREEVYALYHDQLRRKIEERGTRNFPRPGQEALTAS